MVSWCNISAAQTVGVKAWFIAFNYKPIFVAFTTMVFLKTWKRNHYPPLIPLTHTLFLCTLYTWIRSRFKMKDKVCQRSAGLGTQFKQNERKKKKRLELWNPFCCDLWIDNHRLFFSSTVVLRDSKQRAGPAVESGIRHLSAPYASSSVGWNLPQMCSLLSENPLCLDLGLLCFSRLHLPRPNLPSLTSERWDQTDSGRDGGRSVLPPVGPSREGLRFWYYNIILMASAWAEPRLEDASGGAQI